MHLSPTSKLGYLSFKHCATTFLKTRLHHQKLEFNLTTRTNIQNKELIYSNISIFVCCYVIV